MIPWEGDMAATQVGKDGGVDAWVVFWLRGLRGEEKGCK